MNKIKIIYRVDQSKSIKEIEKELENFIYTTIESNEKLYNRKIVSLSIRVSHRPQIDKRQIYLTIIDTNVDLVHLGLSDIMLSLNNKLNSRKIDLKNIVSFHIHLNLM